MYVIKSVVQTKCQLRGVIRRRPVAKEHGELVPARRGAVSENRGRLPVPKGNVGTWEQLSRLVGAVRFKSVRHEDLVEYMIVPLAMLAVDGRGMPYHRQGVSHQRGRC